MFFNQLTIFILENISSVILEVQKGALSQNAPKPNSKVYTASTLKTFYLINRKEYISEEQMHLNLPKN